VIFGVRLTRALSPVFVKQALRASEGIAGLSAAMQGLVAARTAVLGAIVAIGSPRGFSVSIFAAKVGDARWRPDCCCLGGPRATRLLADRLHVRCWVSHAAARETASEPHSREVQTAKEISLLLARLAH
jgi:hypothetical protein